MRMVGLTLMALGVVITLVGAVLYFGGNVNYFGLGRLPGDISIERENVRFYFPISTSILLSLVLTAILLLISRLR